VTTPGAIFNFGSAASCLECRSFHAGFALHASSQDLLSFLPKYHGVDFVKVGKRFYVENVGSDYSKLR